MTGNPLPPVVDLGDDGTTPPESPGADVGGNSSTSPRENAADAPLTSAELEMDAESRELNDDDLARFREFFDALTDEQKDRLRAITNGRQGY